MVSSPMRTTGARVQQPRQATRFEGELAVRIGVRARGNVQVTAQGVLDAFRAGHMAGGAVADVDDVLAHRLVPEHVVERGDAGDRRRA